MDNCGCIQSRCTRSKLIRHQKKVQRNPIAFIRKCHSYASLQAHSQRHRCRLSCRRPSIARIFESRASWFGIRPIFAHRQLNRCRGMAPRLPQDRIAAPEQGRRRCSAWTGPGEVGRASAPLSVSSCHRWRRKRDMSGHYMERNHDVHFLNPRYSVSSWWLAFGLPGSRLGQDTTSVHDQATKRTVNGPRLPGG